MIVDPLWGEPALAAMEAANRFARHVALGQSAGLHAQRVRWPPCATRR